MFSEPVMKIMQITLEFQAVSQSFRQSVIQSVNQRIHSNSTARSSKTMILPLLEYGGVFLGSCTERERTKLQRLQNQALRTIYKKDNHTNLYSLHDKAKLLPLNLRREIALIKIIYNKS